MSRVIFLSEDVTGLSPDNYIKKELVKTLEGTNRLLIPEYGAFYEKDFLLKDADTNEVIDPSKYYFSDLYQEASLKSGKSIWNVVIIKDSDVPINLHMNYRAYGGPYSRNSRKLIEWLEERSQEFLHPANWDEIENIPKKFLPAFHNHLLRDIYGTEYISNQLKVIENAILIGNSKVLEHITDDVLSKLKELRIKAKDLSKAIVEKDINKILEKVNKTHLGLDLVVNLSTANDIEIKDSVLPEISSNHFNEDKYIIKKNLRLFSKLIKNHLVSKEETNLGNTKGKILDSLKPTLIASVNGAVITLDSKKNLITNNIKFDDFVYPDSYPDESIFILTRVANEVKHKGGVFLGFNPDNLDAYVGIFKGDECFRRINWYKFYTDGSLAELEKLVKDHIKDTKNPHQLNKKHVELDLVENYPVVSEADILAQNSVKKYVTLDTLMYFMAAHLLNLKAEPDEKGEVDLKADLFDKANIIYMPCEKPPAPNCPPKGQLIKTFCDGTDKIARYTDGTCHFYDEIMELNSDDCNYVEKLKQGTVITERCDGIKKISVQADGRGGEYEVVLSEKSPDCGYKPPPEMGTELGTLCSGKNKVTRYADGENGTYDVITQVNSPDCGYEKPPAEGTVISTQCVGTNKVTKYADGKGGYYETITGIDSEECGFHKPEPPPPPIITPPPIVIPPPPPPFIIPPPNIPMPPPPPPYMPSPNPPPYTPPPPPSGGGNDTGGGNKKIRGVTSHAVVREGIRETTTAYLSGWPPGASVNVVGYSAHVEGPGFSKAQLYNGGKGLPMHNKTITIGPDGTGEYPYENDVNNNIFGIVGAGPHVTRLNFDNWFVADGIESNHFPRAIERSEGGSAIPAPPPLETDPFENASIEVKFNINDDVNFPFIVRGVKPGTHFKVIAEDINSHRIVDEFNMRADSSGSDSDVYRYNTNYPVKLYIKERPSVHYQFKKTPGDFA